MQIKGSQALQRCRSIEPRHHFFFPFFQSWCLETKGSLMVWCPDFLVWSILAYGDCFPFPWVPWHADPAEKRQAIDGRIWPFSSPNAFTCSSCPPPFILFLVFFCTSTSIWSSDPVPCRIVNSHRFPFRSDTICFSVEQVLHSLLSSLFITSIHLHSRLRQLTRTYSRRNRVSLTKCSSSSQLQMQNFSLRFPWKDRERGFGGVCLQHSFFFFIN